MDENNNNNEPLNKDTALGCGVVIAIILIALFAIKGCTSNLNKNIESPILNKTNPNHISKETFKGDWALTTDNAEIYSVDLKSMTGAKVIIDDKSYAITRNVDYLPFLPDKYWANGKTVDGVCEAILIGKKCKVSLYDFVTYVDQLK